MISDKDIKDLMQHTMVINLALIQEFNQPYHEMLMETNPNIDYVSSFKHLTNAVRDIHSRLEAAKQQAKLWQDAAEELGEELLKRENEL